MNPLLSWIGDIWAFLARVFTVPPGDGKMRAAAFIRFTGAEALGHVGWAFDVSATSINVGAVENQSGKPSAPAGQTGYWDEFLQSPIQPMLDKGYNDLKYVNLKRAYPMNACRVAKWIGTLNYDAIGRNCLDDTYDVLRAYGVPELPPPVETLAPNIWFDRFAATTAVVNAFDWTGATHTGLRHNIAVALRTSMPPLVPTWRRPGHPDAQNLQAQIHAQKTHAT